MEKGFKKLRALYLSRSKTNKLFDLLDNLIEDNYDETNQILVHSNTIDNETAREFPLSRVYNLKFMKGLIKRIENSGYVVNESIYNDYIELLNSKDDDEFFYVTHTLCDNQEQFTFKQKNSLASEGTTGLHGWEASYQLFEQIFSNKHLFKNKRVLELGSGFGLTGILISGLCDIESFTFTDHHDKVLDLIKENLEINGFNLIKNSNEKSNKFYDLDDDVDHDDEFSVNSFKASSFNGFGSNFIRAGPMNLKKDEFNFSFKSDKDDFKSIDFGQTEDLFKVDIKEKSKKFDEKIQNIAEKISDFDELLTSFEQKLVLLDQSVNTIKKPKLSSNKSSKYNNKNVNVINLDWQLSNHELAAKLNEYNPDYVIGSDIVFDPKIIPNLINVFKVCLSTLESCGIVIVCSIRNEDTIKKFEHQLRQLQKDENFKIQRVKLSAKLSYFDCFELRENTKFILYNIRNTVNQEDDDDD